MSSRSPEQLAAHVLRSGLEVFWPDSGHWAKQAFYKPIINPDGGLSEYKARCVTQMIQDSVAAVFGGEWGDPQRHIRDVAGQAVITAAVGTQKETIGRPEPWLVALNDSFDMTYERMRAYVEQAASELEKVG